MFCAYSSKKQWSSQKIIFNSKKFWRDTRQAQGQRQGQKSLYKGGGEAKKIHFNFIGK